MRVHMPYLTQDTGRHRALPATYVRTNTDDLTGHRLAVAAVPARVRAALHRADREYEAVLAASAVRVRRNDVIT